MSADEFRKFIWLDGAVTLASQFHLDVQDEGLLYGLGLFETTRTWQYRPWLWNLHRQRLRQSANDLGFSLDAVVLPSDEDVRSYVEALNCGDVVVRLNVSFGGAHSPPRVWLFARPLPAAGESVRLQISPARVSRSDPFACVKCFNYGLRIWAHRQAMNAGFDDCLLISTDNQILEAGVANVFLRFDDGWVTPSLTGGVLPGTVRQFLLESQPLSLREDTVHIDKLQHVREAFVTNSARGITAVTAIGDIPLSPSDETRHAKQFLARSVSGGT